MDNKMFLVKDERDGVTCLVFTLTDPRADGCQLDVIPGVKLEWDQETVAIWPDGSDRPLPCVGRDMTRPQHYKVFKYEADLSASGFEPVPGAPVFFGRWRDYLKLHRREELSEEDWFRELDEIDEASRRRRDRIEIEPSPTNGNLDEVAAWLAKKHIIVDHAVSEVWYLPDGSPSDEIRFLEVCDRLGGDESAVLPMDFGMDVGGTPLRLWVADITTDQLSNIKHGKLHLPSGWSLHGAKHWRRGA